MADKTTFGEVRRLLSDLGFVQIPATTPAVVFEHKASDTQLFFRPHRLGERVDAMTLSVYGKMLDEKGLLERTAFESALHNASANGASKAKSK